MNMRCILKKIINVFLAIVLATGGLCFALVGVCTSLNALSIQGISSTLQLPIGDPGYLAVDEQGRIFCLSNAYKRIQIYDKNGCFTGGWFTYTGVLVLDRKEETICILQYDDNNIRYRLNGKILEEWKEEGGYLKTFPASGKRKMWYYKTSDGNIYTLQGSLLRVKIVKTSPNGERMVVVKEPLYLSLIKFPSPSFLYIVVPLAIWAIAKRLKKRKTENVSLVPTENSI